jgi:hypothetical protein
MSMNTFNKKGLKQLFLASAGIWEGKKRYPLNLARRNVRTSDK